MQDRRETSDILSRLAYETIVNVRYMVAHFSPTLIDSYIRHSLRHERRLRDTIQTNVAAREGEVLTAGQPIVTIMDLGDTWVRAAIPETESDHIALGDTLRIRLPGGTVTSGKVFFKSPEADFATQRDVSRRKRDIRTIVLKVRLDNPRSAYVPGMTAEVLVSPDQLKAAPSQAEASDKQQ